MTNRDREANEQPLPTIEHSLQSCSTKKLGQRTRRAAELILQLCLTTEGSLWPCPDRDNSPDISHFFEEIVSSIIF